MKQQERKVAEAQKEQIQQTLSAVRRSRHRIVGLKQSPSARGESVFSGNESLVLLPRAAELSSLKLPEVRLHLLETKREPESELQPRYPYVKIKLQLFPIDECTRLRLEKDGHNPFLELTISNRKKISSIIKHISTKWGSSSIALGEIILFPYNVELENIASYKKWSLDDTGVSAEDVFVAVGSPSIFRLRYGWFCGHRLGISAVPPTPTQSKSIMKPCNTHSPFVNELKDKSKVESPKNMLEVSGSSPKNQLLMQVPFCSSTQNKESSANEMLQWDDSLTNLSIGCLLSEISMNRMINNPENNLDDIQVPESVQLTFGANIGGLLPQTSLHGKIADPHPEVDNGSCLQPIEFVTDISIGGLLSEASLQGSKITDFSSTSGRKSGSQLTTQKVPCDNSLTDLSIGGLLSGNAKSNDMKSTLQESCPSLLDAEETCHPFPFRRLPSASHNAATPGEKQDKTSMLVQFPFSQEQSANPLPRRGVYDEDNSLGISGIKWNESLGPFDLGLPISRQVTGA